MANLTPERDPMLRCDNRFQIQAFAVLAAALCCLSTGHAQTNGPAGIPKITCPEPEYNFGVRPQSSAVTNVFQIINTGTAPLQIGKIRACCGASATISTNTIEPGKSAALQVILSIAGRGGKVDKAIYIASNDPKTPHLQLKLVGTAIAATLIEPTFISFGDILQDTVATGRVTLSSVSAINITNIAAKPSELSAACKKLANGWEILISTRPPLPAMSIRGEVQILTDSTSSPSFSIPVFAKVKSGLRAMPPEILLLSSTDAESGGKSEPVVRYLEVRSANGNPFKITKVKSPLSEIKIGIHSVSSGYRLAVSNLFPTAALDGKCLLVLTDSSDCAAVSVPIRVVGR